VESSARITLDGVVVDPLNARRFAQLQLQEWNVEPSTSDVAVLLVSELVTNAVRYAPGPIVVELRVADERLRVAVEDRAVDAPLPVPFEPAHAAETGRGLLLLTALAHAWGTRRLGDRKQVWFELATA
jgi:anti-sigma regulatory factor (Ser/Thr protein kinase)